MSGVTTDAGGERAARVLREHYGLELTGYRRLTVGAGSQTSIVETGDGRFVLKFPAVNEMNNPRLEPEICERLLARGLPVCRFRRSLAGKVVCEDGGDIFHLQEFIEGRTLAWHTAPPWLMTESAALLGRIHAALEGYPLPTGIGEGFFAYMTPSRAEGSYRSTLATAIERGDTQIEQGVRFRLGLLERMGDISFDLSRLTCRSTHGDYFISQLLCGEAEINAVIDWTTACVHPAVWEIIRSYSFANPGSRDGTIDPEGLAAYTAAYMRYAPLGEYDLSQMARLYIVIQLENRLPKIVRAQP